MITINKYNTYCQINGLVDNNFLYDLDSTLSYYIEGYQFSKAFTKGYWDNKLNKWNRWDGKKHLLDKDLKFPAGLIYSVEELFKKTHKEYQVVDKRKKPKVGKSLVIKNYQMRYYQEEAIKNALAVDTGIIKVATGGGKSLIIAGLIGATNVNTLVYVPSLDLLHQTADTIEKALSIEVGRIGDGTIDIKKINVCTIQTASIALSKEYKAYDDEDYTKERQLKKEEQQKLTHFIKNSDMLIFDECQILGAETAQLIANNSKKTYYKYALSGTPHRDDNADLLIEAVCGRRVIDVQSSQLIKENFLVPPHIHFVEIPPLSIKLPKQYAGIYKGYIVDNEERNNKIIECALKLYKGGRKTLILVKQIAHGQILLDKLIDQCNVHYVKGDVSLEERDRIKKEFAEGSIDIIIASTIFDVGIDLPILDALILAGGGKSTVRALQRIGRVIRKYPGKTNAVVVDFIDNAEYLEKHSMKRMEIYRSEPEFKLIIPQRNETKTIKKEEKKSRTMQVKKRAGSKVPW